jgi:uncharacterized protein YicC (UPF0701 family)
MSMTLKSMTGFARTDGLHGETSWFWEVRSVNGRSLDLRLRLPSGLERLEAGARGLCQERLARGNCTVNLGVKRDAGQTEIRLNETALGQALAVAKQASTLSGLEPAQLDTLLGMRGVVETAEPEDSEEKQAALGHALLAGLAAALDQLVETRTAEGERLQQAIETQISSIDTLVAQAADAVARQPADIQEEIDRLRAHVEAAKELIASGAPVGRKLEFLAQEFNREANTICSKASDVEISRTGLELKSVIDQLREQVQNIE